MTLLLNQPCRNCNRIRDKGVTSQKDRKQIKTEEDYNK